MQIIQTDREAAMQIAGVSPFSTMWSEHVMDILARHRIEAVEAERVEGGCPEGWVMVPREPTEAMADAFFDAHAQAKTIFAPVEEVWTAMLAAALPLDSGRIEGA